jgi:hypothetical protein
LDRALCLVLHDHRARSDAEDEVCAWAENNGWLARKTAYLGRRGCPDHHFYGYGQIVLMEFKRINGALSGNQKRERRRIEDCGLEVHVIEHAENGIVVLQRAMIGAAGD